MGPERRSPSLGHRAPGLPAVAVQLDGAFDRLGERRDAAPQGSPPWRTVRLLSSALPADLGERDSGYGSSPTEVSRPSIRRRWRHVLPDAAGLGLVHPEAQTAPATPVAVDGGPPFLSTARVRQKRKRGCRTKRSCAGRLTRSPSTPLLFKTYKALDEDTRENLLRSFREEISKGDAKIVSQFVTRTGPRVLVESRESVSSSLEDFAPVFMEHVHQLLLDLGQPGAFDPPSDSFGSDSTYP